MTNKELFAAWGKHLQETYGCEPDANGDYPCDRGEMCNKCSDDTIWNMFQARVSES